MYIHLYIYILYVIYICIYIYTYRYMGTLEPKYLIYGCLDHLGRSDDLNHHLEASRTVGPTCNQCSLGALWELAWSIGGTSGRYMHILTIYIYMYIYMYVHMYVCTYMYMCMRVYLQIHRYIYIYTNICI